MAAPLDASRPVRWGVLGAGHIASQVTADLITSPDAVLAAVAARDAGRAAQFASRFGAARSYGSYAELVADPDVDVVYVATTHPQHLEHALLALSAGKPVLCEKPMTLDAAGTRTVVAAARDRGLFCMEGMWLRTNPLIRKAADLVADGRIGTVVSVHADLSKRFADDMSHRLFDLALGGGALLDLGVYPINFAWMFLGAPDTVTATGSLAPTGADDSVGMQLAYPGGRFAHLVCTSRADSPLTGVVIGTDGWVRMETRLHRPTSVTVHGPGGTEVLEHPSIGNGYGDEIAEVIRCLRAGLTESPLIPLDDTVAIMELCDSVRAQLGVRYPGEGG